LAQRHAAREALRHLRQGVLRDEALQVSATEATGDWWGYPKKMGGAKKNLGMMTWMMDDI